MPKVTLAEVLARLDPAGEHVATLAVVNDARVRVAKLSGPSSWDSHGHAEFLLVLDGVLVVETRRETTRLGAGEGIHIDAGVEHRARGEPEAAFLAVDPDTTQQERR